MHSAAVVVLDPVVFGAAIKMVSACSATDHIAPCPPVNFIGTVLSQQEVVSAAAKDRVITAMAKQTVRGHVVAGQCVTALRAIEVFNPDQHIARRLATISNAMDVGAPSNFIRIQKIFNNDFFKLKKPFFPILDFLLMNNDRKLISSQEKLNVSYSKKARILI